MYRWVDHTAELELRIEAGTEEEVFAEGLAALAELLCTGQGGGPAVSREVVAEAGDRPALLAAWLEEVVFLAESQGFEPHRVESLRLSANQVRAQIAGRLGAPPPLVKAVTYHRLSFAPADGGYSANVVLDV